MTAYISLAALVVGALVDLFAIIQLVGRVLATMLERRLAAVSAERSLPPPLTHSALSGIAGKAATPDSVESSQGTQKRRPLLVLVIAALTAATVALAVLTAMIWPAPTYLRIISVTSPVNAGSSATVIASVSPQQECSIAIHYKSGPPDAQGLEPRRSDHGYVSWTWRIGSATTPGRWPIKVTCGTAGTTNTSIVVVR